MQTCLPSTTSFIVTVVLPNSFSSTMVYSPASSFSTFLSTNDALLLSMVHEMRLSSRTAPPLNVTEDFGGGYATNGRGVVDELPAFKMRVSVKAASRIKFGAAAMTNRQR